MLETLITYLNALLEPLGFRTHGLTGQVSRGDKAFPAVYAKNGEFHPVNAEIAHVYHRLIDGPTDTDDPDDESPVNNTIVTRTYTIRCVAIFPFGLYGQDDQYEEDKAIRNLNSQLKHRNIKALKSQMKLIEVSAQPGASARGQDAWAEEFVGVEWKGKRHIVYVDYTVVFRGFSDCIVALGCGGTEIDVAQIIRDTYCTDVCDPATVSNSDDSYSQSVASGGALELPDINHVDSDGSTVPAPAQTVFTATPCPDPEPALITVNGDSPALEVDSGTSQDIAIHDSDGSDVGTRSGATVTIGDTTVTVNSSPYDTTEAESTLDVQVVDEADSPVGSLSGGKWVVAAGSNSVGALPLKTGQTTSYRAGDDGDLEEGRATDFYTLDGNNPFGHNRRFTGYTGGYYDAGTWRDKDGNPVLESAAIPEGIVIDWSSWSRDGTRVLGYYRVRTSDNWNDFIDGALAFSTASYGSGWRPPNIRELEPLRDWSLPTNFGNLTQWEPLGLGAATLWTSNTPSWNAGIAVVIQASTTIPVFTTAKTGSVGWIPVRTFSVSGTTLT